MHGILMRICASLRLDRPVYLGCANTNAFDDEDTYVDFQDQAFASRIYARNHAR